MAPSKAPDSWDDSDSDSTPPSSPPVAPVVARRGKFDDEEDNDDVLEDWEEAEDSEVEREKTKKAAEAKAKADAEAKANHKSKSQRIEEKREANMRKKAELLDGSSDEEEVDEAELRRRHRENEKAADLENAEALFGGAIGVPASRGAKPVTVVEGDDPTKAVDLSALKLFSPNTVPQFVKMRETLVPLIVANGKKPQYASFMAEFTKQLCRDLSSEQTKKIASALSTMSNEKMKEEKAADKGGKKTKAAKTKNSLAASRDVSRIADTTAYDDGLEDDDFM